MEIIFALIILLAVGVWVFRAIVLKRGLLFDNKKKTNICARPV